MNNATPTFDYATKKITGATPLEWIVLRAIQLGARISANWGYRGFGACCRTLQKLIPGRTLTVMLADDTAFSVPFADAYWSMLLGGADIYEPEIEHFLKGLAGETYTLVDCGANYGYWSVLASGKAFGAQRVIAIEPSSGTFEVLSRNAALNANRFACLKNAVGRRRGISHLSGRKHEARAVSEDARGETVEMITLDDLARDGHVAPGEKTVVKLDVEGLEIAALSGCAKLLAGDCIVICEDHGSDRDHTVSRHILERTALKLFHYDIGSTRFIRIDDVATLDRVKRFSNRGYNVFATASPYWEERLSAQSAVSNGTDVNNPIKQSNNKTLIGSLAKGHLLTAL
jgi:FkbM family methyltransferase